MNIGLRKMRLRRVEPRDDRDVIKERLSQFTGRSLKRRVFLGKNHLLNASGGIS